MVKYIFSLFSFVIVPAIFAQEIDVKSYSLNIHISDSSDVIHVKETIAFDRMSKMSMVNLDLVSQKEGQKGMKVSSLKLNGKEIPFRQENESFIFDVDNSADADRSNTIEVEFSGIPQDGLIIGKNKFGNRTFFGDNWPERAHHWFMCNDHPADKARINFAIYAPKHYEVIANGALFSKVEINEKIDCHTFYSNFDLPTKVMVFGAADFAVKYFEDFKRYPVSAWVYPENEVAGYTDMSAAVDVLDFFEKKISPYPYEQLANVQSTTRYGGMENAGCIFYSEDAIRGDGKMERLIAHEIAHQWFGNSASEKDWNHLWLSEGFATYFTHLYVEQKYGKEKFQEELAKDRKTIEQFYKKVKLPVVDTISYDLLFMLNTNAYQRGAWVLHTLRNDLGDDLFWKGIRAYYDKYKYSNANTADFIDVMEETSNTNLSLFEKQWLRTGEIPELDVQWKAKRNKLTLTLTQNQKIQLFNLNIEFLVTFKDGTTELITVPIKEFETTYTQRFKGNIKKVLMDPEVKLLFIEG